MAIRAAAHVMQIERYSRDGGNELQVQVRYVVFGDERGAMEDYDRIIYVYAIQVGVLATFEQAIRDAVKEDMDRHSVPFDPVLDSVWLVN